MNNLHPCSKLHTTWNSRTYFTSEIWVIILLEGTLPSTTLGFRRKLSELLGFRFEFIEVDQISVVVKEFVWARKCKGGLGRHSRRNPKLGKFCYVGWVVIIASELKKFPVYIKCFVSYSCKSIEEQDRNFYTTSAQFSSYTGRNDNFHGTYPNVNWWKDNFNIYK